MGTARQRLAGELHELNVTAVGGGEGLGEEFGGRVIGTRE